MGRRFSVFRRKGGTFYYARIQNPETGTYLTKSTGQTDELEAAGIAAAWFKDGIPDGPRRTPRPLKAVAGIDAIVRGIRTAETLTDGDARRILDALEARGFKIGEPAGKNATGPAARPLLQYLREFWDFDRSLYVKERLAFGQSIGRRHCEDQIQRLPHWARFFGEEFRIGELTRDRLKAFQVDLREHVAARTANHALAAGTVALGWLTERGDLEADPSANLRKFAGDAKSRGILTEAEARAVLAAPWPDERSRLASRVAAATGLRANEIAALRLEDIAEDRLYIRHSWSPADGLKRPKNSEEREAPIPPGLRDELREFAKRNPHKTGLRFIFYSTDPDKPCHIEIFRRDLINALVRLAVPPLAEGSGPKAQKAHEEATKAARADLARRGICFHSWRHRFAAVLADSVDIRTLQLGTGHKTAAQAEAYADHRQERHFQELAAAATLAAGRILAFEPKRAEGSA
jgi:integrase